MYTPMGPGYGTIPGPGGDMLVTPEDAARLGFAPPTFTAPDSPVPDNAMGMAPPPVEDPMGAPPPITPAAPVSLAPTPTDGPAPVDPYAGQAPPAAAAPQQAAPPPVDLSATTYADVLGEQQAALADQVRAGAAVSESEAQKLDAQAAALAARNEAIAAKEVEFAKREEDDQKRIADTKALYEAKVQEFADAKVDRNKYKVSPLQAIGVALSGLGSAIKGESRNPALELLMGQIDKYVEDGDRAKAAIGQEAGMFKDRLDVLQGNAQNTLASKNLAVAGVTARTAREIESVGMKMDAGIKRTAVLQLAADAKSKSVEALGSAVQLQHAEDAQRLAREQQERESRRQAASRAADRAEGARQFDLTLAQKIAKDEADRNAAIGSATNTAELALAERGIPDLKAADGSMYQARNKEEAAKLAKSFAATQTINDRVSELIRLKKASGNKSAAMKSGEWQKMQANVADIQNSLRTAFEMGTLDKGSLEQMGKLMGGDPMRDGWGDVVLGGLYQDGAEVGLEQLRKNVIDRFNTNADSMRYPTGPKFQRWEPPTDLAKPKSDRIDLLVKDVQAGKTPDEIRASAKPNLLERVEGATAGFVFGDGETFGPGERWTTNAEKNAEAKATREASGAISKDQRKAVDELVLTSKSKDANEAARAKTALIGLATGNRPAVAAEVLRMVAKEGDEAMLTQIADARAAVAKGEKSAIKGGREESDLDAAEAERAIVRRVVREERYAKLNSPVSIMGAEARDGDAAALRQLEALANGRDASTLYAGPIKATDTNRRLATIELDAILRSKGR